MPSVDHQDPVTRGTTKLATCLGNDSDVVSSAPSVAGHAKDESRMGWPKRAMAGEGGSWKRVEGKLSRASCL